MPGYDRRVMSETYEGRARIKDPNGLLVDVGKAVLHTTDPESGGTWGGVIRVYRGAALAAKTMKASLELANETTATALVGPQVGDVVEGELIELKVVGFDDTVPF